MGPPPRCTAIGIEHEFVNFGGPYVILGACTPRIARDVLSAKDKIGTLLPCNVIVQEVAGMTEVAAVDLVAFIRLLKNERLAVMADKVREEA